MNEKESRKAWMPEIFKNVGTKNSRNDEYQFWRQDNRPIELLTSAFTSQKLDYLHNNSVESAIVDEVSSYRNSSARDYSTNQKGFIDIMLL